MPELTTPDGRTLAWHERGSGPPVLMHPGGPGCSSAYFGQLPELEAERTLLMLDPRGTGGSDRPADRSGYDLEDYAADIELVREHVGQERIDLVGHSHGGFVGMNWAGNHPEHVGRLVLANTTPRFTDEIRERRVQRIASHQGEPYFEDALAALQVHQEGGYSSDDELADLFKRDWRLMVAREIDYEPIMNGLARAGNNADALRHFNERVAGGMDHRELLGRIDAPTLVLAAELDPMAACAEELAAGLPNATLVVLPGADHFTFLERENHAAWCRAVLDHLQS